MRPAYLQKPTQWRSVALFVFAIIVAVIAWHPETGYTADQYRADVNWCIDHGYEMTSDGLNQPVTCLDHGSAVAVPPNSINRSK